MHFPWPQGEKLGSKPTCGAQRQRDGHTAESTGASTDPPRVVTAFWEGGQGSEHLYTSSLIHPDTHSNLENDCWQKEA